MRAVSSNQSIFSPAKTLQEADKKYDEMAGTNFNIWIETLLNPNPIDPPKPEKSAKQAMEMINGQMNRLNSKMFQHMSDSIDRLSAMTASQSLSGKEVQVKGNTFKVEGPSLSYKVPPSTKQATLKISNDKGEVVRVLPANTQAGQHKLNFDGFDSSLKKGLPRGEYTYALHLTDTSDKTSVVDGGRFNHEPKPHRFSYTAPGNSKEVLGKLLNGVGREMRRFELPLDSGKNSIEISPFLDNGDPLEQGNYTFQVISLDENGREENIDVSSYETPTGFYVDNGNIFARFGSKVHSLDHIIEF